MMNRMGAGREQEEALEREPGDVEHAPPRFEPAAPGRRPRDQQHGEAMHPAKVHDEHAGRWRSTATPAWRHGVAEDAEDAPSHESLRARGAGEAARGRCDHEREHARSPQWSRNRWPLDGTSASARNAETAPARPRRTIDPARMTRPRCTAVALLVENGLGRLVVSGRHDQRGRRSPTLPHRRARAQVDAASGQRLRASRRHRPPGRSRLDGRDGIGPCDATGVLGRSPSRARRRAR